MTKPVFGRRFACSGVLTLIMLVWVAATSHAQTKYSGDICDVKAAKVLTPQEIQAQGLEQKRAAFKANPHLNRVYGKPPSDVIVVACDGMDDYTVDRQYDQKENRSLIDYKVYISPDLLRIYKPK